MTPQQEAIFNSWWEHHGQYIRAGGGDYEYSFAYKAWEYCLNLQYQSIECPPDPDQVPDYEEPKRD